MTRLLASKRALALSLVVAGAAATVFALIAPGAPSAQGGASPSAIDVTPNGDTWVPGQNGVVLSGAGPIDPFVALIEAESGREVEAVWALLGGSYVFEVPGFDGSTFPDLPGPVLAAFAVLGDPASVAPPPVQPTTEPTVEPTIAPTTPPETEPTMEPTQSPSDGAEPYYANCEEVREAGADPIFILEPGYGPHLDPDGDGIGCYP
ncbi:MAG TPA: excalibur calcium-binding domain-containing protein [Dehalococcoidia bacterium]|nr:excalibur calcium-binding domain-containing protein [Dehalococcoidia bacterium]